MSRTPSLVVVRATLQELDALEACAELKTQEAQDRLGASLEKLEDAETMTPPRPPKADDEKRGTIVGVKFTSAELERIDAALALMQAAMPGMSMTRSSLIRSALVEGLATIEGRYGPKKKGAKK